MKKKFGIIGNPIKHSLSPVLHEYWFKKYGLDASYSIIEAEDKDLKEIINKIRNCELTGINVTLPFKQKIINQVDKIVNDAESSGSVNTILLENENITFQAIEEIPLASTSGATGGGGGGNSAKSKRKKAKLKKKTSVNTNLFFLSISLMHMNCSSSVVRMMMTWQKFIS